MRRRLTRREKNKRSKQIIMVSTICLLVVMVSGYAAFQTNLTLKAKGNIKEKIFTIEEIKDKYCNTEIGDGLYKDEYEEGRCIFKGTNPANFITFNDETWRIISVEQDNTIKIMRNESIGDMEFDSELLNQWNSPTTLNTYLNGEYLDNILINKEKIIDGIYRIGPVDDGTIAEVLLNEKKTLWTGKVALLTVSEYLRATSNNEMCDEFLPSNYLGCFDNNWIYNNFKNITWLLSPFRRDGLVHAAHFDTIELWYTSDPGAVTPVLYLSSDTTLSGTGTEQDPYTIMN